VEVLRWLAQPLLWLYGFSPVLYYSLVAFLVAVTFFLILRLVRMIRVAMDPAGLLMAESGLPRMDVSAEELEKRAESLAQKECWDEALRWLVSAAILRLEPNASQRRRGMTNRMYLRRFQRTEFGPDLGILVDAFDRVWYGGQDADSSQFEPCMRAYRDLRQMVERHRS
jgi:hypothetical protein